MNDISEEDVLSISSSSSIITNNLESTSEDENEQKRLIIEFGPVIKSIIKCSNKSSILILISFPMLCYSLIILMLLIIIIILSIYILAK